MAEQKKLTSDYEQNVRLLNDLLRLEESFDLVAKDLYLGGRRARLYFVDGFLKDEIMEKMTAFLMKITPEQWEGISTAKDFSDHFITYGETDVEDRLDQLVINLLAGTPVLLVQGFSQAVLADVRTYPARGVSEPEDDRVLRGAHDGFVETLIFNTALIRRRIRDPRLTMDILRIGDTSQTDVVLCYVKGAADEQLLADLQKKLRNISINTLTMSQESLAECLVKRQWYNPFPKVRYTERPDAAAASLVEGNILLLVDNSPSVMILPTSLFDFVQDANDFYFPPLVGTYLRYVRMGVFLLTLFLTPLWYLLIQNPGWLPPWLDFLKVAEPNGVPILAQLLVIEFIIDGLKLASLNTPSVLSNSFSVVGALILGDFAVRAHWFVPEVVLYMAFVAIATFTQPSFELGYALKLFRVVLLVLTALLNLWGFLLGIALTLLVAATTRTIGGRGYLYPLFPFHGKALSSLLVRKPISRQNTGGKK